MDNKKLISIAKKLKTRNGLTKFNNEIINNQEEYTIHAYPGQQWIEQAMIDNAIMNASLNNSYLIEDLTTVSYGNLKRYIRDNFYDIFVSEMKDNGAIDVMTSFLTNDTKTYIDCTLREEKSMNDEEYNELSHEVSDIVKGIVLDSFNDDKFIKKYILDDTFMEYVMNSIKEMMKLTGQQYQQCRYLVFNYFDQDSRYAIGIDNDICASYTDGKMLFVSSFKQQIYEDDSVAFDKLQQRIVDEISK